MVEAKAKARSFRIKATYTPMKSYMISEAPYVLRGGREETAESTPQTEQATVANVSTHGIKYYSSMSVIVTVYVSSVQEPQSRPTCSCNHDTEYYYLAPED